MSGWLLSHVYVLVDFLDFVDVLFQRGVFGICIVYGGLSPLYVGGNLGEFVTHICKTYMCTPRKLFRGANNEGARDVWGFQRSPSRLLSSMVEFNFIPEDKHVYTTAT